MFLNVDSQYSLRYGTMSIPKFVEEAVSRGITQMMLTDINNSTGVMEFLRECDERGVKAIGGLEFRNDKKLLYIGIDQNREGMRELNEFLSEHNLDQKELPETAPAFQFIDTVYPYGYDGELKVNEYLGIRFDQ